jgi:hypothetical protein
MELKENDIVIFKNEKRQEGTKQPEYTGKLNVNGETKDISLWVQESKTGKKYFSGKIKPEYKKQDEPPKTINKDINEQIDDDLPF